MIDPRPAAIERRLSQVSRVIAVTGGKGGIGKTLISSALAATLAAAGQRTGLLDLDFTGPCDHLVLGARTGFPQEGFGILPQRVAGVHFMSIASFAGEAPAPLRGADVSSALIELLAITRWGELDTLVIDMPPGLSDTALDAVRLLPRTHYLVVTSSARLVTETVRRTLALLQRLDRQVLGLVENMATSPTPSELVTALAGEFTVPMLGALPLDVSVEACIGDPEALRGTLFGHAVALIAAKHLTRKPEER